MSYNFDQIVDRKNTNCIKWDRVPVNPQALPVWVADMDFPCLPEIAQAIRERLDHEIFGYTPEPAEFRQSIVDWQMKRHGWDISSAKIMGATSVVPAMYSIVRTFTEPGDKVLLLRPLYGPFTKATVDQGREVASSALLRTEEGWKIDFEDLARKAADPKVKLMFLCNPHNPVGRVYTKEELEQVYQICRTNGVIIAEDEIHSDFIYKGYKHIPLQSLHTEGVITMTAPSKTFNLAALKTAMVICQDDALWEKFSKDAKCTGLDNVSLFGHIATVAAYSNGAAYVDAMVEYLEENLNLVCKELQTMPQISMVRPQGTYLLWLDCTSLGLHNKELMEFFANEAGVTFSEGASFGPEGDGWLRMNIACPRSILTEALARMRKALENK